jgi:hypothetical protein
MRRLAKNNPPNNQNAVIEFIFGAVGTIAALWLLLVSHR